MPMDSRRLAGNGPALSRLGLGLAALGRPAYMTLGHDRDFTHKLKGLFKAFELKPPI